VAECDRKRGLGHCCESVSHHGEENERGSKEVEKEGDGRTKTGKRTVMGQTQGEDIKEFVS